MHRVRPTPSTPVVGGFAAAALALTLTLPAPVAAQDGARMVTVNERDAPAMMSAMMGQEGEAPDTTVTWVKGLKRRIDTGSSSTLIDLADRTMVMVDHEERTWWRFDLAAMEAQMDSMMASMPTEIDVSGSVDVNPTGETMEMQGRPARRVIVTLSMDMRPQPDLSQGYNPMAAMGGMGMAIVNDMWLSDALPTAEQAAAAGGIDVEELMGNEMSMPFPGMDGVLEQMKDELAEIGGEALLTRTYMAMVPEGATLNPDALIALNDQPLPEADMSAFMGGGGGEPVIMLRTVSEVVAVESGLALEDALFAPPADYTETEAPTLAELQERGGGGG